MADRQPIRINLAPAAELENKYWWLPDALVLVFTLVIVSVCWELFLNITRNEIAVIQAQMDEVDRKNRQVQPLVQEFNDMTAKIDAIDAKRNALKSVTEEKFSRYAPVIVLEHLQVLKPEGVWFDALNFGGQDQDQNDFGGQVAGAAAVKRDPEGGGEIVLQAKAFDNILVAEFMTLLKATQYQAASLGDFRSMVYFDSVQIVRSTKDSPTEQQEGPNAASFELRLTYRKRNSVPAEETGFEGQ